MDRKHERDRKKLQSTGIKRGSKTQPHWEERTVTGQVCPFKRERRPSRRGPSPAPHAGARFIKTSSQGRREFYVLVIQTALPPKGQVLFVSVSWVELLCSFVGLKMRWIKRLLPQRACGTLCPSQQGMQLICRKLARNEHLSCH